MRAGLKQHARRHCARAAAGIGARAMPIFLGAVSLLPFAGLLLPDDRVIPDSKWLNCDYGSFQLPIRQFARDEMLAGRFPLWCPWLACGSPLHATQHGSFCHPILMPSVLLCGAAWGLKLCLFMHLLFAFAGSYLFAQSFAISRASSSLCALTFTWSGFAINHLMAGHATIIMEYAAIPWFFLALKRLLEAPGPLRSAALASVVACMFLAGQPQILYYALLAGGLWSIAAVAWGAARPRVLGWGAASAVIALLLGAIQVLPAAELSRDGLSASDRGTLEYASMYSLDGVDVVQLCFPYVMGSPFTGTEPFVQREAFQERNVYLGLLAPLLAAFGLSRADSARWQWGAALLSLLSLAVALGDHTPLFGSIFALVPGMTLFRCPGRVFAVASLFIAALAARGLDALAQRERAAGSAAKFALLVLVWAGVNVAAYPLVTEHALVVLRGVLASSSSRIAPELAITSLVSLTALCVVIAASRDALSPTTIKAAVICLAVTDLGYLNARCFHLRPPKRSGHAADRVARRFVDAPQFPSLSGGSLQYSKLVPLAVDLHWQLIGTDEGGILPSSTSLLFKAIERSPALGLATASCDFACERDMQTWHQVSDSLPRARLLAEPAASLTRIPINELGGEDLNRMGEAMSGTAKIVEDDPAHVVIETDAPVSGRLILADTWYPGWEAMLDGEPARIDHAHGVFRSVKVLAGKHRIVFTYDPLSFRLGLAGSICGLALWCGLIAFGLRRRFGRPRPA